MKKTVVLAMFLSMSGLAIPVLTHANPTPQMNMGDDKKPPLMTLQGTVKMDGDKVWFVNDKDCLLYTSC